MATGGRHALAVFGLWLYVAIAHANCVESSRKVTLAQDSTVLLKSYECTTGQGPGGKRLRVEFHRFSDEAASLVVAKGSSAVLRKTIGTPEILENDVFERYANLRQRFGTTLALGGELGEPPTASVGTSAGEGGASGEDRIAGNKIRTVTGNHTGGDFPAAAEIAALRRKAIPPSLSYYFSLSAPGCEAYRLAHLPGRNPACAPFGKGEVEITFWRTLHASDIDDYAKNVQEYNRLLVNYRDELRKVHRDAETNPPLDTRLPSYLAFVKALGGDAWPDDFVLLIARNAFGCGSDLPPSWMFWYEARAIELDTLLIENASTDAITLDGILGSRSRADSLRAMDTALGTDAEPTPIELQATTLAPGKRLLVPIAIVFPAPENDEEWSRFERQAAAIKSQVGANGFSGNVDAVRTPPHQKDYVYGPAIRPTGLRVDGERLEFVRRTSNFFDLTVSTEIGSCPHLVSWDDVDREWVDHGKVLHEALGRDKEYSETVTIPGLRSRFRLEEREPEVASIDHVALVVTLRRGETVTLQPERTELVARDGAYLHLLWGDAAELVFALPESIAPGDVIQSRFTVTGYYERYPQVLGRQLR